MATMHTRRTTDVVLMAAVATLAVVLAGCSEATSGAEASTRGSGEVTSAPGTTRTWETDTAPTHTPSGALIVSEIPDGALKPGRYALPPIGPLKDPFAVVEIPTGYSGWGSWIYANKPAEPGDPLAIGLWVVTGVYLNPCAESNEVSPRSVRATADALLRQRFTSATRPREVDLAGYHGLYIEVTTPADLDYSRCDDAEVNLWEGRPVGGYWTMKPGMVERLWILDVEGQPMMIHMAVPPSATGPQIRAMTDVVEAAAFETREG
jgi:hypothetical protein